MKNIFTLTAFAAAFALFTPTAQAQTQPAKKFGRPVEFVKCGTTQYEALLKQKNPQRATTQQFEEWIAPKTAHEGAQRIWKNSFNATTFSTNSVVTIPVVVHVIHNGDAIGTDENISEEQIVSQMTVLSQDFRKLAGTPGYNTNPVGADTEIEFCLAQRDPAGLLTSGIIRYQLGSEDGWDIEDIEELKTQIQWNPAKYLNIWIVNEIYVGGFFQLAGYAQFPVESGIEGLDEGSPTTADTDGVVIAANCFGSEDIYPAGNYLPGNDKGRTASHEIGHFFGLRHIWGDENGCTGNDYCADTPVAWDANSGCPGAGWDSCPENPGNDMVQNYMDYTDDSCKNVFTLNQKDRMMAVLANSPRRASLTTSNGCVPGIVYDNDGSLNIQGINPECSATVAPQVVLKNSGNLAITTATISYHLDDQAAATYNWEGNLANGQQVTIQLPEYTLTGGDHTFNTVLASVNGIADQAPSNDDKSQTFAIVGAYNTTDILVYIMTDNRGDETIWALLDSNENFVAGNVDFETGEQQYYFENNEFYTMVVSVANNECYTILLYDLGGNGMCCGNGNGYYSVQTLEGTTMAGGGQFNQRTLERFRIDTSLGIDEVAKSLSNIRLHPNPANSMLNIALPEMATLPDGYTIYNSLGQVMDAGKFASATQTLNISRYANGVYFVKVASGDNSKTLQFIKY